MENYALIVRLFQKNVVAVLIATGISTVGLSGCDYWPPALHSQIEELRADLNDVLDERQRLDMENSELRGLQASMQQEVEDKSRENDKLRERIATLTREQKQLTRSRGTSRSLARSSKTNVSNSSYGHLHLTRPFMKGPRVAKIQRLLRRHDIPVKVDGIYGQDTASAVRGFQRYHKIKADGVVGLATEQALRLNAASPRFIRQLSLKRPPLKGRDVILVQKALRRAGYRLSVDGRYGPETDTAVARFQKKRGLEPDGIVGPRTWTTILKSNG